MATVPKRVADRIKKAMPTFQKVLATARDRDINEADTVTIVTDILAQAFGFDKYTEITSEQAIRGTYCDLAVKLDNKIKYLIEVKAIGLTLKENHLRQAVGYGANEGIPWIVLTNGVDWEVYKIRFEQPISHDLVCRFSILDLNMRAAESVDLLFILCREGLTKAAIEEFHERAQSINRFVVGALVQSDPVVAVIRRELRRIAPGTKVSTDEISDLMPEVLKRDIIEGESATAARKQVARAAKKTLRKSAGAPSAKQATGEADSSTAD